MIDQPIFSFDPEPNHDVNKTLSLDDFIKLLQVEEDYYDGEQHKTKLMLTRLRKIFYDQWGWNSELIRGAASVKMRYECKILEGDAADPHTGKLLGKPILRVQNYNYVTKRRVVVYTDHDRIYGSSRAGQIPDIYNYDHQEVTLHSGKYLDVGHILAGLDACNYHCPVSPLPNFLMFMKNLFPHVDSNMDIVTWLGDIASTSGDYLFYYLRHNRSTLTDEQAQKILNTDAPGSDMLGDIDPYVINSLYNVKAETGMRVTEILTDYFRVDNPHRRRRILYFCEQVGLKNWDGERFSNEKEWLAYYKKQLRDNVTFQVFSLTNEKLRSVWLPFVIWLGAYKKELKLEFLLQIFLNSLKSIAKTEHIV